MSETWVHRSPAVTIGEYACSQRVRARGSEEATARHELVFPSTGVFLFRSSRGSVVADPNQVLLLHRGEPYQVDHPAGGGDRSLVVAPSTADLLAIAARFDPSAAERPEAPFAAPRRLSSRAAFRLRVRLAGLLAPRPGATAGREARRAAADDLEVHERTLELVEEVLRPPADHGRSAPGEVRGSTRRGRRETVEAVQLLLAARFSEALSLADLARAVHSSPYHLARIFRRQVGIPIHRYRRRLRLRSALERLSAGARDLTRLALDHGFFDHSHFTNAFRREFGCAPSQWREAAQR